MRKLCLVFLCLTAIAIKGQVRDDKPIIYEPTVKISFSSSDASHPCKSIIGFPSPSTS